MPLDLRFSIQTDSADGRIHCVSRHIRSILAEVSEKNSSGDFEENRQAYKVLACRCYGAQEESLHSFLFMDETQDFYKRDTSHQTPRANYSFHAG